MDEPEAEGEQLVLAMPRRELFSVRGFVTEIELRVIESLAEESWYATPSVLRDDLEAKEVRLGMLIQRGDDALVDEDGILLHATRIPPEAVELGEGLRAVRELARVLARELLGEATRGVQLFGYFNEDGLPETRPFFVLVYLVHVADECDPPQGMGWVSRERLSAMPLDPASSVVAGHLVGGSAPEA